MAETTELISKPAAEAAPAREAALGNAPSLATTAVLIGVGALIEPELLAGMALGAGIVVVSRWLPDIVGAIVRPVVSTAVKATYAIAAKTTEMATEAVESVQDMVAEARAEYAGQPSASH